MTKQTFSLQPFPSAEPSPDLKITGNISRENNQLAITYQLTGDLKQVVIPPLVDIPTRKNELWENTCFEFFLGVRNSPRYWEFNLSPAGDWNIYRFDGYRQGMQEETAFNQLPFSVQSHPDSLIISLNSDLNQIISSAQSLEVAITTVIKQPDNHITYWAVVHKGAEADFHLRDSFIIMI
ncbi:DOMON-like domain-containing protein [Aliinostoc sp. HNIBRCY26]|uniref:DOMON-like domain-containing protein n=1 Tax=Aliinostoc sp. HNIBRCY26 TaxID=3418997 RepID=UPI003D009B10